MEWERSQEIIDWNWFELLTYSEEFASMVLVFEWVTVVEPVQKIDQNIHKNPCKNQRKNRFKTQPKKLNQFKNLNS